MKDKIIKCTNCGKIANREHLLPLCNDCFEGLEDYEEFLEKSLNHIEIAIYKNPVNPEIFLRA